MITIRVKALIEPEQVARPISILIFLVLSASIKFDNLLPERVTRYRLGLALFMLNSPLLILPNIGYESTLSIILDKPSLSFIKDRS